MSQVVVVMGVCGSGKTHIGRLLAETTDGDFHDGDDFHPPENVAKMRSGQPLSDQDRQAWLERLAKLIGELRERPGWHFVACSALKEAYRDVLRGGNPELGFVFLHGPKDLLRQRMEARKGHFMPPGLLDSQLATLEPPANAISVDVSGAPEEIVAVILGQLSARGA